LIQGPLADRLSIRVADDLTRTLPDLFLLDRGAIGEATGQNPVLALLEKDYSLIRRIPVSGNLLFFVRKGSGLEIRLGKRL
jgi:hypothetical protein